MKITAVEVENYQAIRKVAITPGERALLVIGGRNRQGKSSLLSALEVALGGKRHAGPRPVRDGAESASIVVEFDGGEFVITRRINANGNHALEVLEQGARKRSPQALLDKLVGERFLDPLAFLRSPAREQREQLLQCAQVTIDLDANASERARAYERRTEVGRDLKRAEAALRNLGPLEDEPPAADIEAAQQAQLELGRRGAAAVEHRRRCETAEADIAAARRRVSKLEAELQEARDELEAATAVAAELISERHELVTADELAAAQKAVAAAAAVNANRAAACQRNKQRRSTADEVAAAKSEQRNLTATIDDLDNERAAALAAANFPIPGLGIGDGWVEYNGAPLQQAADSEQLQVSLAIAAALSPVLRDVWVRDGALLDDDSLAAVRRFAEERGCRVWLERVGNGDEGAIVIEDGGIVGEVSP